MGVCRSAGSKSFHFFIAAPSQLSQKITSHCNFGHQMRVCKALLRHSLSSACLIVYGRSCSKTAKRCGEFYLSMQFEWSGCQRSSTNDLSYTGLCGSLPLGASKWSTTLPETYERLPPQTHVRSLEFSPQDTPIAT